MQDVKKRVLILLSDCQETHFLTLINLGESLIAEGIDTTFVTCAHGPCPGSTNVFFNVIDQSCVGQRAKIISVLQDRSLKYLSMHDCVSEEMVSESRSKLEIPAGDDYRNATYRGYNLWDIAKGSICRYLLRTTVTTSDLPVIKRYFSAAILHLDTFPRIFSLLQPDTLIIFNGMALLDRVAREVAASLGVLVFAEENSCFADRKFLDPTGVILNRHIFAKRDTWDSIRSSSLVDAQSKCLSQYLEGVYTGKVNTVSQSAADTHSNILHSLGFEAERPLAVLLAQVPIDSVIVFDSPIYSEMIDFICDVMEVFAKKPDWGLIVRLHPIEEKLFGNPTLNLLQERTIPENVRIVHGTQLNTYALMDCSRFGLTINSQSGLEMLSKHRPVLVAGTAFYADKGFTVDVHSRKDLAVAIDQLCANPRLDKKQADLVDVFLYHFIFEYLLPYDRSTFSFGHEAVDLIMQALQKASGPLFSPTPGPLVEKAGISIALQTQNLFLLGMDEMKAGRYDDALDAFSKADALIAVRGLPEERIQLILKQIEILIAQDNPEVAEASIRQLTEINPSMVSGFYDYLCQAYGRRNDYAGLKRSMLKLLEISPESHGCRFELGCFLEKEGRWHDAWEEFNRVSLAQPANLDVLYHKARNARKASLGRQAAIVHCADIDLSKYSHSIVDAVRRGNLFDALKRVFVFAWAVLQHVPVLNGRI